MESNSNTSPISDVGAIAAILSAFTIFYYILNARQAARLQDVQDPTIK